MTKHFRSGPRPQLDNLTQAGAVGLANTIRAYWYRQGKFPTVTVVPDKPRNLGSTDWTGSVFVVRSDMRNGLPQ